MGECKPDLREKAKPRGFIIRVSPQKAHPIQIYYDFLVKMAKRKIGEQLEGREYVKYLQDNMRPDYYITTEWKRKRLLTEKDFRKL